MSRRTITALGLVLLGVLIGLLWYRPDRVNSPSSTLPSRTPVAKTTPSELTRENSALLTVKAASDDFPPEIPSPIANSLNAPSNSIQQDLHILQDVLDAWRSNYPHYGNPTGENVEITAALTGGNSFHLALIAKNNPAVNADGELCDRWGTPFRFHQLSGDCMEIRSAGPDRKFATPDDAVITP